MEALLHGKAGHKELIELKGLLVRRNIAYGVLARHINVSTQLFVDKINGYDPFDAEELDKIAEYLKLDPADIGRYFFPV